MPEPYEPAVVVPVPDPSDLPRPAPPQLHDPRGSRDGAAPLDLVERSHLKQAFLDYGLAFERHQDNPSPVTTNAVCRTRLALVAALERTGWEPPRAVKDQLRRDRLV